MMNWITGFPFFPAILLGEFMWSHIMFSETLSSMWQFLLCTVTTCKEKTSVDKCIFLRVTLLLKFIYSLLPLSALFFS